MKTYILKIAFLVSLLVPMTSFAGSVLEDKNNITVTPRDIDSLLKPAQVPAQLGLLKNKDRFMQKIQEIYLTKAIAEEQKKLPLSADEQQNLDELLAKFYFERKVNQLITQDLPDFEPLAKLHFEAHKSEFINPEMVAVEHILVDTTKHKENEALKIVNELLGKLKKGEEFGAIAEKYSEDPGVKTNKGKLGLFGKGQMIKEFEDAAYSIKLNEISKPVKTNFGYHILRKYDHKASTPKSFADVKEELISKIKKEYIQARLDDYYEKVKNENEMKINEQDLEAYLVEKTKSLEAKDQQLSVETKAAATK